MILEEITLSNIFSYNGNHSLNLSPAKNKKNLIIILGNNGHGKTSILNTLKLGFHGITDELKKEAQEGRTLSASEYVLGNTNSPAGHWEGLINRLSRQKGNNVASITIKWHETDGGEYSLKREWTIKGQSYEEKLRLDCSLLPTPLSDADEIQDVINERIPHEFSQFFFFDGEKIRQIASATTEELQAAMEGLLKIKLFENLRQDMREIADDYRKSAQEKGDRADVEELDAAIKTFQAAKLRLTKEIKELKYENENLEADLEEVKRKLDVLQASDPRLNKEALKNRESEIGSALDRVKERFVENLAFKLPALINFRLKESVLRRIEKERANSSKVNYLNDILAKEDELLQKVFSVGEFPAPDISVLQKRFYREKLRQVFEDIFYSSEMEQAVEPFYLLSDPERLESDFASIDTNEIKDHAALIKEMFQKHGELNQVRRDLQDTTFLNVEGQNRFEELKRKAEGHLKEIGAKEENIRIKEGELEDVKARLNKSTGEKEKKLGSVRLGEKLKVNEETAKNITRAMERFKAEIRKIKRERLEQTVQEKYSLFTSKTDLARNVTINDRFELSLFDPDGKEIGRASRSPGQKQMLATALLWGLAECAGQDIPTVIDTPLARLDPENIDKMLKTYYPNAGKQVIILATPNELNEERIKIISKNISRIYRLNNPTRYMTEVVMEEVNG